MRMFTVLYGATSSTVIVIGGLKSKGLTKNI